jgi:hypothetical protein
MVLLYQFRRCPSQIAVRPFALHEDNLQFQQRCNKFFLLFLDGYWIRSNGPNSHFY